MIEFAGQGAYDGVPELDYHSGQFGPVGGSLSSTEAKRLLEAPAVYKHFKEHREAPKKAYDVGHLVHAMVLGVGLDVAVIPEDLLGKNGVASTAGAREFIAQARAEGKIPVKQAELDAPMAMAEAVLAHPTARKYFEDGRPEVSIYAETDGVWMRGRVDQVSGDGPITLVDLKTTSDYPTADRFARTSAKYGYALQREWYRHIWRQITGENPPFIHVTVSTKAPHMVAVFEMDAEFELIGKLQVSSVLTTYRACMERDEWPGLPAETSLIGPPTWYANQELDESETL